MKNRIATLIFLLGAVPMICAGQSLTSPATHEKHRTLYSDYHSSHNILRETQQGHDIDIETDLILDYAAGSPEELAAPPYPNVWLGKQACPADSVLIASPKSSDSSESNLTESGDFLYTDSIMRVEAVLKGRDVKDLDFIVTRPGGQLTVNGRQVRMEVTRFPQFQAHMRYLLFLHYLPDTKTYQAYKDGSFLLDDKVVSIGGQPLERTIPSTQHENTFLKEVTAAIKLCPTESVN